MLASGQHLEKKGRRDVVVSVLFCLVFLCPIKMSATSS